MSAHRTCFQPCFYSDSCYYIYLCVLGVEAISIGFLKYLFSFPTLSLLYVVSQVLSAPLALRLGLSHILSSQERFRVYFVIV